VKGRIASHADEFILVDCDFFVQVEDGDVRVGADGDAAFVLQAQEASGVDGDELDEAGEGNNGPMDEPVEEEGNGRFQADDAEGRFLEALILLLPGMGAWSVAMTSTAPPLTAARRASTSSWLLSGGFIL
jgi:hypothetical protein